VIGAGIWYGGSILFQYVVEDLRAKHPGVSLVDFPWGRADTFQEKLDLFKSFSYRVPSRCMDSLVAEARKSELWRGWPDEAIAFDFYQFYLPLSRDSSILNDPEFRSEFSRYLREHFPKYASKRTDEDFISDIRDCAVGAFEIRENNLENILREEWSEQHQGTVSLVAKVLNLSYGLLLSLTLLFYIRKLLTKKKDQL